MPQCVAFDYFRVDWEAVCIEGNSAWGRHVALGLQTKPHTLTEFPGHKKYTLITTGVTCEIFPNLIRMFWGSK